MSRSSNLWRLGLSVVRSLIVIEAKWATVAPYRPERVGGRCMLSTVGALVCAAMLGSVADFKMDRKGGGESGGGKW